MASERRFPAAGSKAWWWRRRRSREVDGESGRLVLRGHDLEALAAHRALRGRLRAALDGRAAERAGARAIAARARRGARRGVRAARRVRRRARRARRHGRAARRASRTSRTVGRPRPRTPGSSARPRCSPPPGARRRAGADPSRPIPTSRTPRTSCAWRRGRQAPDAARAAALDAYLVTVAEHGMNASTFTARVVASTRSDLVSAVVAALGALKGPLHGGAPGPVLDMLDAIGEPERAEAWLEAELAAGRRIMGLGHRVYRVRDPRAAVLEAAVERLESAGVASRYLALARAVERAAVDVLARAPPGAPPRDERRVLHGGAARRGRLRARALHAHLRRRARGRAGSRTRRSSSRRAA